MHESKQFQDAISEKTYISDIFQHGFIKFSCFSPWADQKWLQKLSNLLMKQLKL